MTPMSVVGQEHSPMAVPVFVARREHSPAMPFPWKHSLKNPVSHVFVGVTHTEMCFTIGSCVKEIQYFSRHGINRNTPNLPFNFIIGGDGSVYEGRGWDVAPDLPAGEEKFSNSSIYVGFIGRFWKCPPSRKMLSAMDYLVHYGITNNLISERYKEHNLVL